MVVGLLVVVVDVVVVVVSVGDANDVSGKLNNTESLKINIFESNKKPLRPYEVEAIFSKSTENILLSPKSFGEAKIFRKKV